MILNPIQTQIRAVASNGGQQHTGVATVFLYLQQDGTTKGRWELEYGTDGYVLANSPPDEKLPRYVTQFSAVKLDGTALDVFTYPSSSGDPRALVNPDGTARNVIVWDDAAGFTLSFDVSDSQPHLFGIYCLDFEPLGRVQTIQVSNAATAVVLDTQTLSNFGGGVYLFWNFSGPIQIKVTQTTGPNAVVSGFFFR